MSEIEVRIFKRGSEIARVLRPLRYIEAMPAVKYKRKFWPLINGCEIHLDNVVPQNNVRIEASDDSKIETKPPDFHTIATAEFDWDKSQYDVINSPADDRLLVDAGPGTGKTAVACARVSRLINQDGLEPSQIWLISFTHTAVHEIRDRIAKNLDDDATAYAVNIATLDSHAWTLHSGFDEGAKLLGSYEENIQKVVHLVRQDENISDYLYENVRHLVIDEAQDIVGIRATLILEIINKLSPSCGLTVFADEAQAIYGFAQHGEHKEAQSDDVGESSLPEVIRHGMTGDFRELSLTEVHRTHSSKLLKIFSDTRNKVLTASETGKKLVDIRDEIARHAHGEAPRIDAPSLTKVEDTFILYRRRCDVLLASSILSSNNILHRIRMSRLPVCLAPWIGAALSEHVDSNLSLKRFMELWEANVCGTPFATYDPDKAWEQLIRLAGRTQTVVDMRRLRQCLGRKRPPAELCGAELGNSGPIIGTIHASKGREADTVHLMLPKVQREYSNDNEEARVLFVGATRGCSQLLVGRGWQHYAKRVEPSGRTFRLLLKRKKRCAQVEIGLDGDIAPDGLVGRQYFPSTDSARFAQNRIRCFANKSASLIAKSDGNVGFAYRLWEEERKRSIAALTLKVNYDLFTIGKMIRAKDGGGLRRPPSVIRHLHVRGLSTVVLQPDAPTCETLHDPWRSSGIMLAPLVLGYSMAYFSHARGK